MKLLAGVVEPADRYHLTRRQRTAVTRCACSSEAKERRHSHCVAPQQLHGRELWLDGFNVLTAVETALGGGVILIGRDGCCRDVAGVYSHYHKVEETLPALQAIGRLVAQCGKVLLVARQPGVQLWPFEGNRPGSGSRCGMALAG